MHFSVMFKLEKDDHLFSDDIKEINSVLKATKKKYRNRSKKWF